MSNDPMLFPPWGKFRTDHPDTAKDAAKAIAGRPAETQRAAVLDFLTRRGTLGATDEEIQQALSLAGSAQRPRRVELVERGAVRNSGLKRFTSSGRRAIVWGVVK